MKIRFTSPRQRCNVIRLEIVAERPVLERWWVLDLELFWVGKD